MHECMPPHSPAGPGAQVDPFILQTAGAWSDPCHVRHPIAPLNQANSKVQFPFAAGSAYSLN
jgi:hypothetical protein